MRAKLTSVKAEMTPRPHLPIPEQARWLSSVLLGRYGYYAAYCTLSGRFVFCFLDSFRAEPILKTKDET
ncbi:MAG: hypothetical protein FWD42_10935, partial [Solirubrobacterales bacterium]|nr:hypothetical protein [Solirubrobacterales bacterium]